MNRHFEEKLYRIYMTNAIHGIGNGEVQKYRYIDLLSGNIPKEDDRSGDEIAADVIKTLGLKVSA